MLVDHLMLGAPDLAAAMDDAERRFGFRPEPGGSHPGLGTRNALLGLCDGLYLEIIAPDPAQPLEGTFGAALAELPAPALVTFAAATRDLSAAAGILERLGYAARGPVPTRRATPDGGVLAWELLFPRAHPFGSVCPFFIDWGDSRHPSAGLAPAGRLRSLTARHPKATDLAHLLRSLDVPVEVAAGGTPALRAELQGDNGTIVLEATARTLGLRFG